MHVDSLLNELSLSHEFGVVRPYRAFFILCQFDIHFFVCSVTKDEEVAGLKVIKVKKNPRIVYHSTLSFMFCSDATPMFMNLCLFCRLLLLIYFPCSHTC